LNYLIKVYCSNKLKKDTISNLSNHKKEKENKLNFSSSHKKRKEFRMKGEGFLILTNKLQKMQ